MFPQVIPWCREVNDRMFVLNIRAGELARRVGMSREYVSSIIHGRHFSPKAMKKISDALDIPFEYDDEPVLSA